MKNKTITIIFLTILLCFFLVIPSSWAGSKERHRWEGVAIGLGAAVVGSVLLNNYSSPPKRHVHIYHYSPPHRHDRWKSHCRHHYGHKKPHRHHTHWHGRPRHSYRHHAHWHGRPRNPHRHGYRRMH